MSQLQHFKTVSRATYRKIMDSFPKNKVLMTCTSEESMIRSASGVKILHAKKIGEDWSIDCIPGLLVDKTAI